MLQVCVFLWQEQLTNPFKYWPSVNLLLILSLDQNDCVITSVDSSITSCSVNVSVCWLHVGNWKGPDYMIIVRTVTWGNIFNLDTWQQTEKTNMKSFYGTSSAESHVHYHWTNKHGPNWWHFNIQFKLYKLYFNIFCLLTCFCFFGGGSVRANE